MTWLESPSICAAQYLIGPSPPNGPAVACALESVLADLAQALEREGCRLLGHIKALAQGRPQGYLYASLVSPDQGVSLRGELPYTLQEVRLTFNLIVYRVEQDRLPDLLDRCVREGFPGAVRTGGYAL